MPRILTVLLFLFASNLVKAQTPTYNSDLLRIETLTPNVYIHISYILYEGASVPCNGLIYVKGNEAFIIDSPNDNAATAELITWIEKSLKLKISGVLATHFHTDCLGGFETFHAHHIPTYSSVLTKTLAAAEGNTLPQNTFSGDFELFDGAVYCKFFGEGHTKDNIVAYLPSEKVLFGGCLIKTMDASKGYLGDANVNAWPSTIRKIKAEYPILKHVIPGHGNTGGADLLDYTIRLFSE